MAMLLVPRPIRQGVIESHAREFLFAILHLPQLSTGNVLSINGLVPGLRADIQSVERFMQHTGPVPVLRCKAYWANLAELFPNTSFENLLKNVNAPTFIPEVRNVLVNAPNCGCENMFYTHPEILNMPSAEGPSNVSTVFNNWKSNLVCGYNQEHQVVKTIMNRPRILILSFAPGTVTFDNIDIADCIEGGQDGDDMTYVHVCSIYKSLEGPQGFRSVVQVLNQNPYWHHGWLRYSGDRVERSAEVKTVNVLTWCFAIYMRSSPLKDQAKVRKRVKASMPMGKRELGEANPRYVGVNVEMSRGAGSHE